MPDRYTYPGTDVLVNLPGYIHPDDWKAAETAAISARMFDLLRDPLHHLGGRHIHRDHPDCWRPVLRTHLAAHRTAPRCRDAQPTISFWPAFGRAVADGIRMLAPNAAIGTLLMLGGLIPLLGQTVIPLIAAVCGGWILAVELTGYPFTARGFTLRERRSLLAHSPARTLGFSLATYLLFVVPLGAVLAMPAAVAGATLLARRALDAAPTAAAPAAAQ